MGDCEQQRDIPKAAMDCRLREGANYERTKGSGQQLRSDVANSPSMRGEWQKRQPRPFFFRWRVDVNGDASLQGGRREGATSGA
ncbi:uncharacterized protein SPSK_04740 [Sporothrix schenckii 1099-18]|uniref:Uncharacterized protein n=1 Tax=Sporothrix schenckii 1099-18 TaxID=1397361 RepID=A0A0F2M5R0_SPOSC|nr:uncharacterized protein SPSK_04740 [Sporothrix schenckii 1099-18]KJR83521.1 hypothetical protein SPSK_04740 [Sporothrix schenckii 1099-18]